MKPLQVTATDCNLEALVTGLENILEPFLNHLQLAHLLSTQERQLVLNPALDCTNVSRLLRLIPMLKPKDSWSAIVSFLNQNGLRDLAVKLQSDAGETALMPPVHLREDTTLSGFALALAEYYMSHYSHITTLWGDKRHVRDVWVPLQLEETSRFLPQKGRFDHAKLLSLLDKFQCGNAALIKGDPGVGKTTLLKKIAYDWAERKLQSAEGYQPQVASKKFWSRSDPVGNIYDRLALVLTVPLRSLGTLGNFEESLVDYFIETLRMSDQIDRGHLLAVVRNLRSKLLICLDGLDEYHNYSESPFGSLIATTAGHKASKRRQSASFLPYKLIISTRNYACEHVDLDYFPLRLGICGFDDSQLGRFVQSYCRTKVGVQKATKFYRSGQDVVVSPMILSFACYLADKNREIPATMTELYESFLQELLIRAFRERNLQDNPSRQWWNNLVAVNTTSQLAFNGCLMGKFEFTPEDLQTFDVTDDSFNCAYLRWTGVDDDKLKGEFPHRSMQEFFAAVCCHSLFYTNRTIHRAEIVQLICMSDSQVGQFFFGLCSNEHKFGQLLEWLWGSYADVMPILGFGLYDPAILFQQCLLDCSSEDKELIRPALKQLCDGMQQVVICSKPDTYGDNKLRWFSLDWMDVFHTLGKSVETFAEAPKRNQFALGLEKAANNRAKRLDQLQTFFIDCDAEPLANILSQVDKFPPFETLIVSADALNGVGLVNFLLTYSSDRVAGVMKTFCYHFGQQQLYETGYGGWDHSVLSVKRVKHRGYNMLFVVVRMAVMVDRPTLIRSLTKEAIRLYQSYGEFNLGGGLLAAAIPAAMKPFA